MIEDNEIREPRLDLTQSVRDTLGRGMLYVAYQRLKASGEIPADESAEVKPAPASDVALIAEAYRYLQEAGQLPLDQPDVVVCVHSSGEVNDFFVSRGLGECKEAVCKFLGIESVDDLKLITVDDIHGSQFNDWARGSLTIVQQKKMIKAFS